MIFQHKSKYRVKREALGKDRCSEGVDLGFSRVSTVSIHRTLIYILQMVFGNESPHTPSPLVGK